MYGIFFKNKIQTQNAATQRKKVKTFQNSYDDTIVSCEA